MHRGLFAAQIQNVSTFFFCLLTHVFNIERLTDQNRAALKEGKELTIPQIHGRVWICKVHSNPPECHSWPVWCLQHRQVEIVEKTMKCIYFCKFFNFFLLLGSVTWQCYQILCCHTPLQQHGSCQSHGAVLGATWWSSGVPHDPVHRRPIHAHPCTRQDCLFLRLPQQK